MPGILIVDDEMHIRRGLAQDINWARFGIDRVYSAANAPEAIEVLKRHSVDLVITDVRMPGMNGLEFIAKAKALDSQLRFIIISAFAEFNYAKDALHLGVIEYLLKPVNLSELIQLVVGTLGISISPVTEPPKRAAEPVPGDGRALSPMTARCIEYIRDNYMMPISLADLAAIMERNPSYISHIFHKETEVKLVDYISNVRVTRSIELIENTTLALYEIAEMVGFGDYRQFVRVFKKVTGMTPTDYARRPK